MRASSWQEDGSGAPLTSLHHALCLLAHAGRSSVSGAQAPGAGDASDLNAFLQRSSMRLRTRVSVADSDVSTPYGGSMRQRQGSRMYRCARKGVGLWARVVMQHVCFAVRTLQHCKRLCATTFSAAAAPALLLLLPCCLSCASSRADTGRASLMTPLTCQGPSTHQPWRARWRRWRSRAARWTACCSRCACACIVCRRVHCVPCALSVRLLLLLLCCVRSSLHLTSRIAC